MLKSGFTILARVIFLPIALIGLWNEKGIPRIRTKSYEYKTDWSVFIGAVGLHLLFLLCWLLAVMYCYSLIF